MSDKVASHLSAERARSLGPGHAVDNVRSSPFFVATASVAVIGWLIAFFASIAANAQNSSFPHFAWWAIMFQLFVTAGTLVAIVSGALDGYRLAICAFLGTALSFTSSTANVLIYSSSSAEQAAAAGHIFLSMVNICWILYFGSTPDTIPHRYFDTSAQRAARQPIGDHHASSLYPSGKYGSPYPKSNMEQVAAGLKNPILPAQPLGPAINGSGGRTSPTGDMNAGADQVDVSSPTTTGYQVGSPLGPPASESSSTLDFKYRARAIYTYEANAEDPNEIGFAKGEILEVADISGKWFQARNAKGEVGIAPSNYLTLIGDNDA